jgi:peptidoglycan hydrolase-like protein with peptidoglycan-binding domain
MTQASLPTLNQGDSGPAVALLQRLLVLYGYTNLLGNSGVDGKFGPATNAALLQFQRDQNLEPKDGIVGPDTWFALTYPAGTTPPA